VTNGSIVVETKVENGSAVLAQAAVENLMTWKLGKRDPTTFIVVYKYRFSGKMFAPKDPYVVILRLPFEVEVIRYRK